MEINNMRIIFPFLSVCLFISGCAITSVPNSWLPTAGQTQTEAYGGWIDIRSQSIDKEYPTSIRGELIALGIDTVYVLEKTLIAIPKSEINNARLVTYDSKAKYMGAWTLAGIISTISHGYALVISAPTWIIGGGVATIAQSHKPILDYPKNTWSRFERSEEHTSELQSH